MITTGQLKIGWLLPYSGLFPSLKGDVQLGLDTALRLTGCKAAVTAFPEFIQTGAARETEAALQKLLLYEQVDLIMGVVGTKVAVQLIPLLEQHRTPLLLLNLGADIPPRELSSDYLFYNSLHLWKSEWTIGHWAQKKYGGEPSVHLSQYEAGYRLHEAFRAGTAASGAQTLKLTIVKNIPGTAGSLQQQTGYVHALLSGKEGRQFLDLLTPRSSVTVNPFMVEDGLLETLPESCELYNASTWSASLDTPENLKFIEAWSETHDKTPNVFSLLSYEAGLVLAQALHHLPARTTTSELRAALAQTHAAGPRGALSLSTRPLRTVLPVYIRLPHLSPSTGKPANHIVATETGIEWDHPALSAENNLLTGWQNPYLCV